MQLDGQLDLLDLLEDSPVVNDPHYVCVCDARIQCNAPARKLFTFQEDHRPHREAFEAAQWPGGRENHPNGKLYGPLLTIEGENLAATLTTKAPHPVNLGMRYACPCCLTNWGELKPEIQARIRGEHAEVEPGICRAMAMSGDRSSYLWNHHEGRPTPWATGPVLTTATERASNETAD